VRSRDQPAVDLDFDIGVRHQLWYQAGSRSAPVFDATRTKSSPRGVYNPRLSRLRAAGVQQQDRLSHPDPDSGPDKRYHLLVDRGEDRDEQQSAQSTMAEARHQAIKGVFSLWVR
jgi:hypothetical protein